MRKQCNQLTLLIINEIQMMITLNDKRILSELENSTSSNSSLLEQEDIKGTVSKTPSRRVPYMEIVGQVHGTYIIAQNENGMFMIDQHAAQERIKYEYFRDKIERLLMRYKIYLYL